MNKLIILLSLTLSVTLTYAQTPKYKNPDIPVDERVNDLLNRMTLAEKLGQLRCPLGWPMYSKSGDTIRLTDDFRKAMSDGIGNFYGVLRADPWTGRTLDNGLTPEQAKSLTDSMQRYAMKNTRLGIPLFFAEEAVHGHMAIGTTVMPTGLLQASTFDTLLMRQMGSCVAAELRSLGGNVGYGPVVDIAREPRWSRMEETMGEDPYLTGEMASAVVRGMQGSDLADGSHVCTVLKHFAAYGIPEGGLNGEEANIGPRRLLDEYIPQFKRCINDGATGIMTSYNSIDGVPCTANRWLLTDLLRNQWGFRGMVISDLISIEGLANTHHVAHDYKDAALMALDAGVDIDLQGNAYALLRDTTLTPSNLAAIDSAVARVLRLKFRMGLFDTQFSNTHTTPRRDALLCVSSATPSRDARLCVSPATPRRDALLCVFPASPRKDGACSVSPTNNIALQIAREGITLLKNDGILPILDTTKTIAVIGPNADNIYNQLGDYTAPQPEGKVVTMLEGLRKIYKNVRYIRGCAVRDTSFEEIKKAVKVAKKADFTVFCVGGSSSRYSGAEYMSTGAAKVATRQISDMECGEGYDRADLHLMGHQERLMQALIDAGVKLVVVYIEGRPLNMNLAAEHANALLTAWYPGKMGGQALAEIISGKVNPSGRLPISIPRNVGQLPVYYSKRQSHDYIDSDQRPLYSFGYGMSYTTFEYSDIQYDNDTVTCTVTNTGSFDGDEVVQLYIKDVRSSVVRPEIMLRGFTRVHLKAGESTTVRFPLTSNPGDAPIVKNQIFFGNPKNNH